MARPKDRDLASKISTLSAELELATFLNKGVLQTNSEYKVRIVELERENAVLRVAESRLARTEDRLAVAEKQLRERAESEALEWNRMISEVEVLREGLGNANRRLEGIARMAVVEHVSVSLGQAVRLSCQCVEETRREEAFDVDKARGERSSSVVSTSSILTGLEEKTASTRESSSSN